MKTKTKTSPKVKLTKEEETILKKAKDILQRINKDFENGHYGLYDDNYENGMEDVICDICRAAVNII